MKIHRISSEFGRQCQSLLGDAEAIIFSVELLCDSYMQLRNNLNQYLDLLTEVNRRFAETHEALMEQQKKEAEEVFWKFHQRQAE